MPLQKNQVLTLTIERLSNDGSGVAHSPDGAFPSERAVLFCFILVKNQ